MKAKKLVMVAAGERRIVIQRGRTSGRRKTRGTNYQHSDVPAAGTASLLRRRRKAESIIRWEKEGANYEAVIQKEGNRLALKWTRTVKC